MIGQCGSCGCTDANACPGGCFWANSSATLCSRCAIDWPRVVTLDELGGPVGAIGEPFEAGVPFGEQFPLAQAFEAGGFEGGLGPTFELGDMSADELDELERLDVDAVRERADWRTW